MSTARNRFLREHGECHEVTGIGSDGVRVVLRRFATYTAAQLYSRSRQPHYVDLRIFTTSDPDTGPVLRDRTEKREDMETCGSCRNKLLWSGEAICLVDNKRHRLHYSCKHYTDMSRSQVA
jgi:hypothetical protein